MKGDQALSAPAHPRWLLLSLEGDVDQAAQDHVDAMIGGLASAEFIEETVAMVAGLSRTARRLAEAWAKEQELTYAAWMLMPEPNLLLPGPLATLRVRQMSPADTDDDVIEAAMEPTAERHGPVDVDVLETASGRALSVRYRPVVERDGVRAVHEHRMVLWPRRPDGVTLDLSLYVVDLVEGGQAAEPLLELARSIEWTLE